MSQGLVEAGSQQNAILLRFANEPKSAGPNLTARAKAVLIYRYNKKERDIVGSWLQEGSEVIDIEPDSRRHKLIVGMLIDGKFAAITGENYVAHRRTWYRSDNVPLEGFQTGTVVVRVMDVMRGSDLLYEREFAISLNPLTISPKEDSGIAQSPTDFWLQFHPTGSRALHIQNNGGEPAFDVVIQIPAGGSGFKSDVINRVDNDRKWVTCGLNGQFVWLDDIRGILSKIILNDNKLARIPVLVSYRTRKQQGCEYHLEIRLPLKDGIHFSLPE
jgi:hypothetical protein